MVFGVGVSCRILYSIVSYLNVSCSGSIASVGEERASLSGWRGSSMCLGWATLFYYDTP